MKRMQNKEIGFKKQRICIGIDAQWRFALSQLKKEDAFLRITALSKLSIRISGQYCPKEVLPERCSLLACCKDIDFMRDWNSASPNYPLVPFLFTSCL